MNSIDCRGKIINPLKTTLNCLQINYQTLNPNIPFSLKTKADHQYQQNKVLIKQFPTENQLNNHTLDYNQSNRIHNSHHFIRINNSNNIIKTFHSNKNQLPNKIKSSNNNNNFNSNNNSKFQNKIFNLQL